MEDTIQPTNYTYYPDSQVVAWGNPNPYEAICMRSYIKQVEETAQAQSNPGILGRIRQGLGNIRRDLNPKNNAVVFARDFLPGLIVGFIANIAATANPLMALQKTLEQQAQGVALPPGDFAKVHGGVLQAAQFILLYLKSSLGLQQKAKDFDDVIEGMINGKFNKQLDVKTAEAMAEKVGNAIEFVEDLTTNLNTYKNQIIQNVMGKSEAEIIANAQLVQDKPMGIWAKIVNWVRNKFKRNKAYTIKIVEGELDQYITNLGITYHIAALSGVLLHQISQTSIMNRNSLNPRAMAPDALKFMIDQIQDTFSFLSHETMATLDYVSIKVKLDSLQNYFKVYISTLNDNIEPQFKIVEMRSICLLLFNNLRDLSAICMKMDPLIAVTAI